MRAPFALAAAARMLALWAALGGACVPPQQALAPPAAADEPPGTLSCGEVVKTCTSECEDPLCVQGCKSRGNPQAQEKYGVLLACAQQNGCMDEDCIMSRCQAEVDACKADGEPVPPPASDRAAPAAAGDAGPPSP